MLVPCPAWRIEQMTFAKPTMVSNPLASRIVWRMACQLSPVQSTWLLGILLRIQNNSLFWWMWKRRCVALELLATVLRPWGEEYIFLGHIWHQGWEIAVRKKQNWASMTSFNSWNSCHWTLERHSSTFILSQVIKFPLLLSHLSYGGGHGNPLQCSCLENPGRGAWWAAVCGVAQSQTRLKWLSSSSSRPWILLSLQAHRWILNSITVSLGVC